jgi:rubrerythrin
MDFEKSETRLNLMRAFAGESQARNRYVFAAKKANESGMYVIEILFKYTAEQEEQHAKLYYEALMDSTNCNIPVEGNYPIDLYTDVVRLLRNAQHNENQEYENDYAGFAKIAKDEGFDKISTLFTNIAAIEKTHSDRFKHFADLIEDGKLYLSDIETKWVCLKCGFVYEGKQPPERCPVCNNPKGYYVRLEMLPSGIIK